MVSPTFPYRHILTSWQGIPMRLLRPSGCSSCQRKHWRRSKLSWNCFRGADLCQDNVKATLARANHNSKQATLYSLSVPIPGNWLSHKDSTAILVLTTNGGDLMIRLTLSSLEVKTFYMKCVQIRGELLGSESRSNTKLKSLQDSSDLGQEAYRRDSYWGEHL